MTHPGTAEQSGLSKYALFATLAVFGLATLAPDSADAFAGSVPLRSAPRWNAEPHRGTGLADGIQVGVQVGVAEAFATSPQEVALLRQALADAFAAWENPALQFDVAFDAPVERGAEPGQGLDIDVFARPGNARVFVDSEVFSHVAVSTDFVSGRLLSNGQRTDGEVITGADIYLNIDNIGMFLDSLDLTQAQDAAFFKRLLMHAIGHALGLGDSDADPSRNLDSDFSVFTPIPIDPCDVEAGLILSPNLAENAVMSNSPTFLGLFVPEPGVDDIGFRDALYPAPAAGVVCGAYPLRGIPAPEEVVFGVADGFERPRDLLVDSFGRLLIAGLRGVTRVNGDGSQDSLVSDEVLALLGGAVFGATVGPDTTLYLGGDADNVVRIGLDGEVVEILDATGDGVNRMSFPGVLTVDAKGNVYAASVNSGSVFKIDPEGNIERVVTSATQRSIGALVTDSVGNLYVAGVLSDNIVKRTPDGSVRIVLDLDQPAGLAVDSFDRVYTVDRRGVVWRIEPDESVELFAQPEGVTPSATRSARGPVLDALGNVYVLDAGSNLLFQYAAGDGAQVLFDIGPGSGTGPGAAFTGFIASDQAGSIYASRRIDTGERHEVFRVDPICRHGLETPAVIRGVWPRRPRAGGILALVGREIAPGARVFLDKRALQTRFLWQGFIAARLPKDASGDAELTIINPVSCRSDPFPIEVRDHPRGKRRVRSTPEASRYSVKGSSRNSL